MPSIGNHLRRTASPWAGLLLLAAPSPLAAAPGGGLFTVDLGLSVWTIVVFLLVLWVLGKFAWGPILAALSAREKGIQQSIDEAHRFREEGAELLEQHRKQLAQARREAQQIIAEGRQAGEEMRKELEEKGRAESQRLLEQARREIERERDQALEAIRREGVDLALAAAARLLHERLDQERDRQIVTRYLDELEREPVEA